MRSRYLQIALTYTKPWPMRIWAMLSAAGVVWMLVIVFLMKLDSIAQMVVLFLGGTITVWVGAMITAHAKEQLADPRAALTPRFRTPHLVVAAVMFIIFVVGLAMLVAGLPFDDVSLSGYLAIVLTMTAAMAWMAHFQSPIGIVFLMLLVTPVMFASGRAILNDIVHGRAIDVANVILAAAIISLAALWARMAMLHAEMPEYSRTMGPGFRLRVQMTGDPTFRRESAAGAGAVEAWVRQSHRLDKMAGVAAAGFWKRAQHWRIVIGLGRTPIFVALVLGFWSFILPQLIGGMRDRGSRTVLPITLSALVPGVIVAAIWPRRWYTLAEESLRPVSRRQFVREQGGAMALEMGMTWLWLTVTLFGVSLLLEPSWYHMLASPLWRALPIVISGQILTFGVIVWVMRYRSGWLVVVPMLLATFTGMGVLVVGGALAELNRARPMQLAAVIFAAVGLAITYDAYRRWLTTEFD